MKEKAETIGGAVHGTMWIKKHANYSIWGAVSLGLIIIILIVLLVTTSNPKPAFTINGQGYSLSGLNQFISSAKKHNVNKENARLKYIAIRKDQYVAGELGVQVTNADINTAATSQFGVTPNQSLDDYENLVGWDTAFHNQVLLSESGGYTGAFFNFPFTSLFVKPYPNFATPAGFGNPTDIQADMQYAMQQANYYHKQLKNGSMTVPAVITALSKNSRLFSSNSGNGSFAFTVNTGGVSFINQYSASITLPSYVLSAIHSLNGTGLTNVMTQTNNDYTAADVSGITLQSPQPVAYYFVDVQSKITSHPNIDNMLSKDLSSLKVGVDD